LIEYDAVDALPRNHEPVARAESWIAMVCSSGCHSNEDIHRLSAASEIVIFVIEPRPFQNDIELLTEGRNRRTEQSKKQPEKP
jgi:hypothetical protein